MEHITEPWQVIFIIGAALAFGVVMLIWMNTGIDRESPPEEFDLSAIVARGWAALWHWRPVKASPESDPRVMSRSDESAAPSSPSSLQTSGVQTPDQTDDPAVKRAKLLDTYRPLRKLGMGRDDARAFLKPWGIPLDNNLWAEAAPAAEESVHVTPIVGRPTRARFETDADHPYLPLEA